MVIIPAVLSRGRPERRRARRGPSPLGKLRQAFCVQAAHGLAARYKAEHLAGAALQLGQREASPVQRFERGGIGRALLVKAAGRRVGGKGRQGVL